MLISKSKNKSTNLKTKSTGKSESNDSSKQLILNPDSLINAYGKKPNLNMQNFSVRFFNKNEEFFENDFKISS